MPPSITSLLTTATKKAPFHTNAAMHAVAAATRTSAVKVPAVALAAGKKNTGKSASDDAPKVRRNKKYDVSYLEANLKFMKPAQRAKTMERIAMLKLKSQQAEEGTDHVKEAPKKRELTPQVAFVTRLPGRFITYNAQEMVENYIKEAIRTHKYRRAKAFFARYYNLVPETEFEKRARLLKSLRIRSDVVFGAKKLERQKRRWISKYRVMRGTRELKREPRVPMRVDTTNFPNKESSFPCTLDLLQHMVLCGKPDMRYTQRLLKKAVEVFGEEPIASHRGIMTAYAQCWVVHRKYTEAALVLERLLAISLPDGLSREGMTQYWYNNVFDARFADLFVKIFSNTKKWANENPKFWKQSRMMRSFLIENTSSEEIRKKLAALPKEVFRMDPKKTTNKHLPLFEYYGRPGIDGDFKPQMLRIALSRGIHINHPIYSSQKRPQGKGLYHRRAKVRANRYRDATKRGETRTRTSWRMKAKLRAAATKAEGAEGAKTETKPKTIKKEAKE